MKTTDSDFLQAIDEDLALRTILEGTATDTGEAFFDALVVNLARALGTKNAWVSERINGTSRLRALAFWLDGRMHHGLEWDFTGTPCEPVMDGARYIHLSEGVQELYPDDAMAREYEVTSYVGAPLMDVDGEIIGNLGVFDSRPTPENAKNLAVFRIFAARAAAELQRIRSEERLRASEEKYRRIVETAGEGFAMTDNRLTIRDVNDALCRMLGFQRQELIGKALDDFGADEFRHFLGTNREALFAGGSLDVKGRLVANDGRQIPVLLHGSVLRDKSDRMMGNVVFVTDLSVVEKSLALAAEVQQSLLPPFAPFVEGLDVAGFSQPCEDIGGDYFDFIEMPDAGGKSLTAVVGDMSGHGVDAALLMTTARAFLRMRARQPGSLSSVVTDLNRHITSDARRTHRFMTLFLLSADPYGRSVEWVRAGHDPAMLFTPATGLVEELMGSGVALGVEGDHVYTSHRLNGISKGQIIVLGTDGIWEAHNTAGEMFGKERMYDVIRKHRDSSAQEIVDRVFAEVNAFARGTLPEDDKTLVVIKFDGWTPAI